MESFLAGVALCMPSIEQLERLLKTDPDDTFLLYGLGQARAKEGEHDKAVQAYDRCLAIDPGHLYAYYHKARSLDALGRTDEACVVVRAGIEAASKAGDAHARFELENLLTMLS